MEQRDTLPRTQMRGRPRSRSAPRGAGGVGLGKGAGQHRLQGGDAGSRGARHAAKKIEPDAFLIVVKHLAHRAGHEYADADTFGRGTPPDALHDARVADGGQGFLGRGGIGQGTQDVAERDRLLLHER